MFLLYGIINLNFVCILVFFELLVFQVMI